MAKYEVTYACGHKGEVNLFGSHRSRESKIAWYADCCLCPECYAAQKPKGFITADGDIEHPEKPVMIRVAKSYEIRTELKSRGYRYDGSSQEWKREVTLADFRDEIDWLKSIGAAVSKYDGGLIEVLLTASDARREQAGV